MNIQEERHPEYLSMLTRWTRCRDAREGEDAIHAKGETYLPKLGDQEDDDYEAYKLRARWFNAFAKTVSGFVGLATRTPVVVDVPDEMDEVEKNIDRTGADVASYIKKTLNEVLEVGRCGTLVDYTKVPDGATKADSDGARPYWVLYKTENILNWLFDDGQLVYVVLREIMNWREMKETGYYFKYRVLELEEGIYTQKIYHGKMTGGEPVFVDTVIPKINSKTFDKIPFVFHQSDFDVNVDPPPLMDLVNLNFSHYRLKADHIHGLHLVSLPTPYIIGVDPEDDSLPSSIGPQKLWVLPEGASVGMLEFTGAGIAAISSEMDKMEEQMAMLGARMLISDVAEQTATASKIKSISETADLASIVTVLNVQFNNLIATTTEWFGSFVETSVTISKSFMPVDLDPAKILALVTGWQQGGYDYETLFLNLQRGEVIDSNMTVEEMQSNVDTESTTRNEEEMALIDKQREADEAKAAASGAEGAGGDDDTDDEEE